MEKVFEKRQGELFREVFFLITLEKQTQLKIISLSDKLFDFITKTSRLVVVKVFSFNAMLIINFPTGFCNIINNVVETFFDTLKNIACCTLLFAIKQCREQESLALQSFKWLKAAQFLSLVRWISKHRWYCGEAINNVKTNCLSHSSTSSFFRLFFFSFRLLSLSI